MRQKIESGCVRMLTGKAADENQREHDGQTDAKQCYLLMPPRAWRPGLEPAELSFRVPHFFHQTPRGPRGTMIPSMTLISLGIKK